MLSRIDLSIKFELPDQLSRVKSYKIRSQFFQDMQNNYKKKIYKYYLYKLKECPVEILVIFVKVIFILNRC